MKWEGGDQLGRKREEEEGNEEGTRVETKMKY